MGVSLAWHLAQLRAGSVTLLERSTIAAGASGRTGALLRQHYSNRPEATLAHASLQVFRNWSDAVGGSCGFEETGLVVTIPTGLGAEENVRRLHANVQLQQDIGISTRVISPAELQSIDPHARVDDVAAAAYEPKSGCVDAVAATQGMAHAAIRAGATVIEGVEVTAISTTNGRVTGIETTRGYIPCGTVVCAAGPWSAALLAPIGVEIPIDAVRVQVATFVRPLAFIRPHAAYVDIAAGMFCRPFGAGRTLVGVSGGDQHDPVDPASFNQLTNPGYAVLARAALARRFPIMAEGSFLSGHAGLYDMTPDAHPVIGPVGAGIAGLYVAAGFSGAGFKKGPAVGQALAETIVHGSSSIVDLSPFGLDRFAGDSWRNPWSENEYVLSADFGHKF